MCSLVQIGPLSFVSCSITSYSVSLNKDGDSVADPVLMFSLITFICDVLLVNIYFIDEKLTTQLDELSYS